MVKFPNVRYVESDMTNPSFESLEDFYVKFDLKVVLIVTKLRWTSPLILRNTMRIVLTSDLLILAFMERENREVCQSAPGPCVSWPYSNVQDVITLCKR